MIYQIVAKRQIFGLVLIVSVLGCATKRKSSPNPETVSDQSAISDQKTMSLPDAKNVAQVVGNLQTVARVQSRKLAQFETSDAEWKNIVAKLDELAATDPAKLEAILSDPKLDAYKFDVMTELSHNAANNDAKSWLNIGVVGGALLMLGGASVGIVSYLKERDSLTLEQKKWIREVNVANAEYAVLKKKIEIAQTLGFFEEGKKLKRRDQIVEKDQFFYDEFKRSFPNLEAGDPGTRVGELVEASVKMDRVREYDIKVDTIKNSGYLDEDGKKYLTEKEYIRKVQFNEYSDKMLQHYSSRPWPYYPAEPYKDPRNFDSTVTKLVGESELREIVRSNNMQNYKSLGYDAKERLFERIKSEQLWQGSNDIQYFDPKNPKEVLTREDFFSRIKSSFNPESDRTQESFVKKEEVKNVVARRLKQYSEFRKKYGIKEGQTFESAKTKLTTIPERSLKTKFGMGVGSFLFAIGGALAASHLGLADANDAARESLRETFIALSEVEIQLWKVREALHIGE